MTSKTIDNIVTLLLCITIRTFLCLEVVLNLTPPISRDALIHHLAVPRWNEKTRNVKTVSYFLSLLKDAFVSILHLLVYTFFITRKHYLGIKAVLPKSPNTNFCIRIRPFDEMSILKSVNYFYMNMKKADSFYHYKKVLRINPKYSKGLPT